eukprot:CAMPEP_0201510532 /NCGR_PEP_ID=MMETSP0161_2-20130828/3179_1 /ASSEMBLY_ACC=CAM_ASM_000251 /TAXON_ID=180227 /ORGANISM="Neoparamoeba aestuarina, Strain SoJaBio B1-5/56/2" /LENGTH=566 /DNA_ID=CAMNT_0047905721 /DNA_START=1739 /DNA_END=3442 /DNA_ORIENTATION=-
MKWFPAAAIMIGMLCVALFVPAMYFSEETQCAPPEDTASGSECEQSQQEEPEKTPQEKYNDLIKEGDAALKNRQYTSAHKQYSAAIRLDSKQFSGYYKRALANMQRSNSQSALSDLDQVIALKSDYLQAYIQRGNVLTSLGHFKEARIQYNDVLKKQPGHSLTKTKLGVLAKAENAHNQMLKAIQTKNLDIATFYHKEALGVASESRVLNFLKVFFASKKHDYDTVNEAAMTMIKQNSKDVEAIMWRAIAFFRQNRFEVSKKHLKEVIKFDPENKLAKAYIKKIKKYTNGLAAADTARSEHRWEDALKGYKDDVIATLEEEAKTNFISKAIENSEISADLLNELPETGSFVHPELYRAFEKACESLVELKRSSEAIKMCTSALEINDNLLDAHYFRAKAKMQLEEYDSAYGDAQKIMNIDRNNQRGHSLMKEIQKLQKMQKRVDYYKVLGVEKSATPSQIKKAYRKLAVQLHPDKVKAEEREDAEKKMQKVNEAYEVLGDAEKRGKYDRGEDLDEQFGHSGGGHGGNPFEHFGFNFGDFGGFGGGGHQRRRGGGQQKAGNFKFHFR